jgi:hypothetical protein
MFKNFNTSLIPPRFQYESYVRLETINSTSVFSTCSFVSSCGKTGSLSPRIVILEKRWDAITLHDHFWFSFLQAKLWYLRWCFQRFVFYIFNFSTSLSRFPSLNRLAMESDMKFIKVFDGFKYDRFCFVLRCLLWLLNSTTPFTYSGYNSAKAKPHNHPYEWPTSDLYA